MDNTLYVALSGAKRNLQEQRLFSNNLANAATPGFRSDISQAASVYLNGGSKVDSVFSVEEKSGTSFKPGSLMTTGRSLDIAANDKTWIAVVTPSGEEAYVRTAQMQLSSEGQLMTGNGLSISTGGGGVAIPPNENIQIAADGTITVVPQGGEAPAAIGRIKLVEPLTSQLKKGIDGLFYSQSGQPLEVTATASITSGALESSNVNVVDQMVNMILANREFDTQLKLMGNVDDNQQAMTKLLQLGN